MNDFSAPQRNPHRGGRLFCVFAFLLACCLPGFSQDQFSLNFDCGNSRAIDAAMIGTTDSLDATIIIPGDTSLIDSILVEISVKGNPVFWGSTTITTSAGEVVVIPFPGLITNTGSNEEAAIYRAWVQPCQSLTATTPVADPLHYDDWQSMTTFQIRQELDCLAGASSDGDILLFHACDTFFFDIDTVAAAFKDVQVIAPISELGDVDTTRSAIVIVNAIHNNVVTNLSTDTFFGTDNLGDNALLFEKLFNIAGNIDSVQIIFNSPDGAFSSTSCSQMLPFGGDSFIVGTVVVSASCEQCCTVTTNCDSIPDVYLCEFGQLPSIPDALLDSVPTYALDSTNLDSLAFAGFGGSYTTTFCDTVYIIASDDSTGAGCPADTGFVIRTFTFYNQTTGGIVETCQLTYVVIDTILPVLVCAPDTALQCTLDGFPPYATFTLFVAAGGSASDECALDPASFTLVSEISDSLTCPETISRTYSIADSCGNVATCVQLIALIDTIPPVISCPEPGFTECSIDSLPAFASFEEFLAAGGSASDDCALDSLSFTLVEQRSDSLTCPETVIRLYRIEDLCGNAVTCEQVVVVNDTTPPTFNPACQAVFEFNTSTGAPCPDEAEVSLEVGEIVGEDENWTVGPLTIPSLSGCLFDNCTEGDSLRARVDDITETGDACDLSITVLFTILDACDNESVDQFVCVVNIHDDTPPTITCPDDMTVECDDSSDPSTTGSPIVADNCQDALFVTFADVVTPGLCPQAFTITRTWLAADSCGNQSTCVQTIQVIDSTGPAIVCPDALFTQCSILEVPAYSTFDDFVGSGGSASDNCALDESSFTLVSEESDGLTCPETVTRTYSISDSCGNASSCIQVITINDTIPPVVTCPEDITLGCFDSTDPGSTGFPIADDNCTAEPLATYTEIVLPGVCDVEMFITRTWFISDECGNVTTCVQTISVEDNDAPQLTIPEDIVLQCGDVPVTEATAIDECTDVFVTYVDLQCSIATEGFTGDYDFTNWTEEIGDGGAINYTGNTEVELVGPDGDCNDASTILSITIPEDGKLIFSWSFTTEDLGPNFDPFGYHINGTFVQLTNNSGPNSQSGLAAALVSAGDVFGFEQNSTDCIEGSGATTVIDFFVYTCAEEEPADLCDYTVFRCWSATDECGNTAYGLQQISVADTTAPVIVCPADADLECTEGTTPGDTGTATATDNCSDEVAITFVDVTTPGMCPQEYTITRTWYAEDSCGNVASCVQTINVDDTTPPALTCPAGGDFACDGGMPFYPTIEEFIAAGGIISDNCALDSASFTVIGGDPQGPCPAVFTFLYSVSDECGNLSSCVHVVTVTDDLPPSITCPEDLVFQCIDEVPASATSIEEFIGLGGNLTDNCALDSTTFASSDVSDGLTCPETITRTYSIADFCGNISTCIQTITIDDTTPPVISCGVDMTLECSDEVPPASASATDNCDSDVTILPASSLIPGDCPGEFVIFRSWTATDDCGNSSVCTQVLTFVDTTPPVISCPLDATVDCNDEPFDGNATATDNCDLDVAITFSDETVPGECDQEFTINRTWTATDDCGNTSTCLQVILVDDNTAPQLTVPDDVVMQCADFTNTGVATAIDNCGDSVLVEFTDLQCDTVVEDFTGDYDFSNWTQFIPDGGDIVLNGNTDASLVSADNNGCEDESTTLSITVPADGKIIFSWNFSTLDDGPQYDPFGYSINGVFVQLSNNNGGFDQGGLAAALVTAGDVFAFEQQSTDCIFGSATTTVIDFFVFACAEEAPIDSCNFTTYRCWSATDECGNTSYALQRITVEDTEAPSLTCPDDLSFDCLVDVVPFANFDEFVAAGGNAFDNCELDTASFTVIEATAIGPCPYVFTFVYGVSDVCGNSSTCEMSITTTDDVPPSLTCPEDVADMCGLGGFPAATTLEEFVAQGGNVVDNCEVDTASFTLLSEEADGLTCPMTLTRTYLITDLCGNSATCEQQLVVDDTTPPSIVCPGPVTVSCASQVPAVDVASVTTSDNCGGTVTVTHGGDVMSNMTCPNRFTLTRTYIATDLCGNSASCQQIITVNDITAPSITCPGPVTVPCASQIPAPNIALVTVSDNCGGTVTVVHVSDVNVNQTCPNRFQVNRTYRATDLCGNTAQCVQVITVNDVTAPTITCPPDMTVFDPDDIDPTETGTPVVGADNCGGTVTTTSTDAIIPGECAEQFTVNRTWTATDACGNSSTCLQVIVVDVECSCDLICQQDITINLDPGACSAIFSYNLPELVGACPMEIETPTTLTQNSNTTLIQDALQCGVNPTSHWRAYDLAAMGVAGDFQMNSLGMASWSAGTVQVFVYAYTGTLPSTTLDVNQMTLLGQANPMAVGGFQLTTHNLTAPVLIPEGSKFVVEQRQTAGGPWCIASNYAGNTQPAYMNCIGSIFGFPAIPTSYEVLGYGFIHPIQVLNGAIVQQGAEIIQIEGLPSGSEFPIGTTTNCFVLVNSETGENVDTCCFDVVVQEYPFQIQPNCNDLIQISLDQECQIALCADMILEGGPYGCYDDFEVYVDQFGFGNDVNCDPLTYTYGLHTVTIYDPETGNSCWGEILVEDKLPPSITCTDYTLTCGQDLTPVFTPPIQGVNICSAFPGLPIGPNAGVITESTCTVSLPQGVEILDVNVCVKITHTWIGDCNTDIISPSGAVTNLWGFGQCGATDNMHQKFDDAGPLTVLCADINDGCDFILQPVSFQLGGAPLAQYNSTNPNGEWTLMITDNAGGDGGTLDEWHLEIEYAQNAPFAPEVSDNCDEDVTLTWEDEVFNDLCDTTIIERTWTATDDAGNTAQCVQTLTIEPLNLDALQCPPTYEGECGQSSDPSVTGWPTIDGIPVTEGGVCNIFVGYWDQELADCGAGVKIVRRWSILDWCSQEVEECIQIIKLTDEEGPVLECPADQTVGTDPWFCDTDVVLEVPEGDDQCGTAFTLTPSVTAGVLVHFGGDFWRVDNLPVGVHTVTWTAEDACGNASTCEYDITVVDDVPPVPLCDEHTVLTLTYDDGLNEGLTKLHAEILDDGSYDNCGPVTFLARRMDSCIDFDWIGPNGEYPNNDGGQPESLDRGLTFQTWVPFACCDVAQTIMVELRVTDVSGNINSCMVEVYVQDKLPPLIVCPPDITVSCEFWFDAHETNGFEPFDGLENVFGRVLDAYDYEESDREYVIIDDPGNTDLPQPFHWGLDGWADDNCDVVIDVRTRIFDDCSGDDLPSGAPDWAVRLVERTFRAQDGQGNTSTCRQRIWVVDFDPFYITDVVCGLNNADDVRWPCDLVLTDCPEGDLTPENLSAFAPNNAPIVNDDNCSVIGMTYDDQIFYFVDNACYKIIRTWTVIDWCQYDPVEETGIWYYTQVIKVHDEDGPEFENCPDEPVTYCVADPNVELPLNNQVFLGEADPNSSSCSVHVWEERTVHETCSDIVIYDVKIYPFNGSEYVQIVAKTEVPVDTNGDAVLRWDTRQNSLPSNHSIRRYGLPYNDRFCSNWPLPGGVKDYHRVLWSVEDGCGNLSTCEYLFRLEDCKQPTPICVGLSSVVMPTSGSVTIWAKDFDSGSTVDDCTAHEDLLFSFSGDVYEPSREFDCAAIEANGSPSFLVEIWVADEGNDQNCNGFVQPLGIEWGERNKDYCTTFIVIDDNTGVCGDSLTGGLIETELSESVEKVRVNLRDINGQVMSTFMTQGDGFYHFINPLIEYTIEPERNDNHKNGVSTLDLVAIQKHLLGLQPLNSPYKMIAADANNSESVSALDLVEVRKLILGLYAEFPKNTSWRFVDGKFDFADPTHPWPFTEVITSHDDMTMEEDFVAVKVGDVNGTVVANATQIVTRGARNILKLQMPNTDVRAGETIAVPVTAQNYKDIVGYQFTMELTGLNYTGVEPGAIHVQPEFIASHDNAITMSWADTKAVSVEATDVLFTLHFTAATNGQLEDLMKITSAITEAEAYSEADAELTLLDVTILFGETLVQDVEYALYQNEPNPFTDQTVIGFDLPAAMSATLTLYDMSGRVVRTYQGDYSAGYNQIVLKRKDLGSGGAYYYHLQAGDFTASKKMILNK